jgi:hypothetical protein
MNILVPLLLLIALPAQAFEIKRPSCDPNADIEVLIKNAKARWNEPAKDDIDAMLVGEPYDELTMRNTITNSVKLCQRQFREYEDFKAGKLTGP